MRACYLLLLLATSLSSFTRAFSVPRQGAAISTRQVLPRSSSLPPLHATPPVLNLRGGASIMSTVLQTKGLIASSLQAGPWGIPTLWAIASSVVVPLTLYRQAYSFSVGYGFSVLAMALSLVLTFYTPGWTSNCGMILAMTTVLYGLRLGSFLLLRQFTSKQKASELKSFDKTRRLKRIPFAVSVALFYAFLTTPCLYALRVQTNSLVSKIGLAMSVAGAMLEAIADGHKFHIKRQYGHSDIFCGPTGGVYRLCRHPNYLGEVLFWMGVAVNGAPSFGKSISAWMCSFLGLYGIVGIMRNATSRLDAKQAERYKGQPAYELWKEKVRAPLVPFVRNKDNGEEEEE